MASSGTYTAETEDLPRNDIGLLLSECHKLLKAGRPGAASNILEAILPSNLNDPRVLHALGRARLMQRRSKEAAALLEKALRIHGRKHNKTGQERAWLESSSTSSTRQFAGAETVDDSDLDLIIERARKANESRSRFDYAENTSDTLHDRPTDQYGRDTEVSVPKGCTRPESSVRCEPSGLTEAARIIYPSSDRIAWAKTNDQTPDCRDFELDGPDSMDEPVEVSRDSLNNGIGVLGTLGLDEAEDTADELYFEGTKSPCDAVPSLENWEDIDEDISEFDDALTREDLDEDVESSGPISKRQRALQVAIELGLKYGWDAEGVHLLAAVFERHLWSAARKAMERQLEAGLEPVELERAIEVRALWSSCPEFWQRSNGYQQYNLSWPVALAAVRSFGSIPDVAEIEVLMWECFERWHHSWYRRTKYASFYDYLRSCLGLTQRSLKELPWITFESSETEEEWTSREIGGGEPDHRLAQEAQRLWFDAGRAG